MLLILSPSPSLARGRATLDRRRSRSGSKMPATAGRVRMPANNRVHSSAALQTHGIWQSAIGYDPYAPNKDSSKQGSEQSDSKAAASVPEGENAYASFQGLLALARLTSSNADEARGACKKCGRVGHLTYQCRNFLSVKEDIALQTIATHPEKSKANGKDKAAESEESSEEEDESESSDSSVDSEIERIIAARSGKGLVKKSSSSRKNKHRAREESDLDSHARSTRRSRKKRSSRTSDDESSESEEEDRRAKREKRRRHKHSEADNGKQRKSRKEKRRRRDYSSASDSESDEDDIHRRTRRSSDSERDSAVKKSSKHKKREKSPSDSDDYESTRGRSRKRSEKRSSREGVGRGPRKGARSTGTERMSLKQGDD
ncbi:CAX-interacting protein 4 [Nymphaea thermarum]|nr:CAX-interacting protein 4 [Nymphaea thermarum]